VSRRALAFILGMSWCQTGCEFRDAPNVPLVSGARTDLTFKWVDDVGPREVKRTFQSLNGELASGARVPVTLPPKTLTILGIGGSRDCVANIWVRGESNVRLDCVTIEGQEEITLRGLDLALQDGVDGIHAVRVETDTQNLNFSIRTLPRTLEITRSANNASLHEVGAGAGFHLVGEFQISRSVIGELGLHWPTKIQAKLKRRLTRHDYDFDFLRCVISQTSRDSSEILPLEVIVVEQQLKLTDEWPKLFSLESQLGKLGQSESTTLSLFANHAYLDKVFAAAPFKEVANTTRVDKECAPDRAVYREHLEPERMIGSPIPRSTHAFVRIGTDEDDPALELDLQEFKVTDPDSLALDSNPISRTLTSKHLEIILSNGGSR
jgi:hypothetical protein